jgi:hypothetical protein
MRYIQKERPKAFRKETPEAPSIESGAYRGLFTARKGCSRFVGGRLQPVPDEPIRKEIQGEKDAAGGSAVHL